MRKWLAGVAILVLVPFAAAQSKGAAALRPVITIPFELIDNRIFVNININGRGPFHTILDTGADMAITPEVAKQLGLQVHWQGELNSGVGESAVQWGDAHLDRVELAGAEIRDVTTNVIPTSDGESVFGKIAVDAVLGQPFFEKYVVRVDYIAHRVTIMPPSAFDYRGRGIVIPFTLPNQIPVVNGSLDSIAGRFGVDTGARSSLLLYAPFCEKNNLRAKYTAKLQGITGWGIGGPVRSLLARAKEFRFGDAAITEPIIRLSTQKKGATAGTHLDGLIGPDILKQFTVYLDYPRKRIILEKNANYGERDSYDRLGAWFGQQGDQFVVLDVIDGGPAAEAGMHRGDTVLFIDGVATEQLVLTNVRDRFKTEAPGTKVRFLLSSGGTEIPVVVTLRDLV